MVIPSEFGKIALSILFFCPESFFHRRVDRQDQWLATGLVCEVKPGSTDAGTGKDASTSLAAGDGSFTEATLLCCSASTESIYC